MAKGSNFEREICTKLSLWWTQDLGEPRDDVFWRTSQSGGRATQRGKKGKKTSGQHSDMAATDPVGQPFVDMFTVEMKRGYSRHTIADLLDRSDSAKEQQYEEWFRKAERDCLAAGTQAWLLIVKRDRRETLVFYPAGIDEELRIKIEGPEIQLWCPDELLVVCGVHLDQWLLAVKPDDIRNLLKQYKSK